MLYILDEPSIGLHQRDNARLLSALTRLRDLGNSVLVVEHDEDTIRAADYVIDMGPRAGVHGGRIVAAGTPDDIAGNTHSLTGAYLSGRKTIEVPRQRRQSGNRMLTLQARARAQPRERDGRLPDRRADLRDRRVGLGQVDAGDRHAAARAGAEAESREGARRSRTTGWTACSTSTR